MSTPRVRSREVIGLLERAYDLSAQEEAWLRGISDAALPLLDDGFGTCAWKVDQKTGQVVSFVTSAAPEWVPALVRNLVAAASGAERAIASRRRFMTLSQNFGAERWLGLEITKRHVLPYGVADAMSIQSMDAEGRFLLVVCAPLRKTVQPTAVDGARWSRVASHVAAASRLRERLLVRPSESEGEAVVSPSGELDHAQGKATARSARDILRGAVLRRERALTGRTEADAEGTLRLWRGLVEGRWSLVDRFERDGRRYIVAHPNGVEAPGPRTLTAQERSVVAMAAQGQPLKLIAYDLGLSVAVVSHSLRTGMEKLGARSRAELVRIYATLHGGVPDDR
jgi:DNA-binding CsgD family transcriptional regulator